MKCDELKDYDIMDIEAMDDERLEKSKSGKIQVTRVYIKSEVDKVIAEKDAEIAELKSRIAPKQSDKSLQERLNEVCEKHGVSTLQDLDWAFCESEKRHTNDCIESVKAIAHHKYKRCLTNAEACMHKRWRPDEGFDYARSTRHMKTWLELSEKFKQTQTAQ